MKGFRHRSAAVTILLLMITAPYSHGEGKTIWKVNVAKLRYRGDAERTIVRWRGRYVVIGSATFMAHEENRQCVLAFDAKQPLLVFDVVDRRQAPKEALARLEQEWEPPQTLKSRYPCNLKNRYAPETTSITDELEYQRYYDEKQIVVLDKAKKKQYRISPGLYGCWSSCIISSRAGNRFALLDKGQTLSGWIIDHTSNLGADDNYTDKKRIRVFSAADGKKLLEKSWAEPDALTNLVDRSERVAFSDDGQMLAFLDDKGELHVVRIFSQ